MNFGWILILSIPIACIAWTFTHEELFKEAHEFFVKRANNGKSILTRKFFYLLTCEYCFSHYVTIFFLIITKFTLFFDDWRGYIISGFALVWIANVYMTLYALLKQGVKKERIEAEIEEIKLKEEKSHNNSN